MTENTTGNPGTIEEEVLGSTDDFFGELGKWWDL